MRDGKNSQLWWAFRASEFTVYLILFSIIFYFLLDGKELLAENFWMHGGRYYTMAVIGFYFSIFYGPISFIVWKVFSNGSRRRAILLNAAPFIVLYGGFAASAGYLFCTITDTEMKIAIAATVLSYVIVATVNIFAPILLMKETPNDFIAGGKGDV